MKRIHPLARIALRNGLVAGLLAISMMLFLYYKGDGHPLLINPFMDFRIVLFGIFIFFTLKEFRDQHNGGILYFWQGMVGSYAFVAAFGLLCALFILIFGYLHESFISDYIQESVAQLKSMPEFVEKIGKEDFERNFEKATSTNGYRLAIWYFGWSLIMTLFISTIISVVLRRQPKI
ncbi:MAG: DUF4199 domain-containing protein [Cyclobacteriaceae bacterium]|nr:DUF4199 domain-containing protein [Cyclobacteriaceae bacterium]